MPALGGEYVVVRCSYKVGEGTVVNAWILAERCQSLLQVLINFEKVQHTYQL
jgi:hypothetical protein